MPTSAVLLQDCERLASSTPLYRVSLAQTMEQVVECQKLRYQVFNLELGEGLQTSRFCKLDRDSFDLVCDHMMVNDALTGTLVGTYRLQTGYRAKANLGYYSEQLFDFPLSRPFAAKSSSWAAPACIWSIAAPRCCTCSGKELRGTPRTAARVICSDAVR